MPIKPSRRTVDWRVQRYQQIININKSNLLESFDDWTISIENKLPNRVAYIDFSRAFDSVSHPKLLHKLKSYGIDGILLDWVASFCLGAHTVPRWGMFIHRFSISTTVVWFKAAALVRYCFGVYQ